MKTSKTILLTLLAFLTIVPSAFAWGGKGHDIVAEIASRHVDRKAKKEIERLLDGRSMVFYSTWMDNIRGEEQYKHTSPWHYVNVDEGEEYTQVTTDPKGDVCSAVVLCIDELKNKENNDSVKAFYLKALIHFVGDMHCPMHAGHRDDLGGNRFAIKWFGTPTSLHSLWDSKLIESVRPWSYVEWADNIDYKSAKQTMKQYSTGTPLRWMQESVEAADLVYSGTERDQNYSYDYMTKYFPTLEQQLLKGGYRLAYLLNEIF